MAKPFSKRSSVRKILSIRKDFSPTSPGKSVPSEETLDPFNRLRIVKRSQPSRRPVLIDSPPDTCHISLLKDRIELRLPIPPSINHQYATVNGRRVLSARGRKFKALVGQQILIALSKLHDRQYILKLYQTSFLALSIRFHFPSPLRRDVDGGLKITQDALCEALGVNDNRILHIHLHKALDVTYPRMEISLSQLNSQGTRTSPESPCISS